MPVGYPLRQYPDICHPRGAQYAIQEWHWAWQSTHGRQSINPMPLQHASIVRLRYGCRQRHMLSLARTHPHRAFGHRRLCLPGSDHTVSPVFSHPLPPPPLFPARSNGSTPTVGVGAYSEGLNDDLNKAIWSGLALSPDLSVAELVAQYARYHFGAEAEAGMVAALFGLEQNWLGDIQTNSHVLTTLASLQAIEKVGPCLCL